MEITSAKVVLDNGDTSTLSTCLDLNKTKAVFENVDSAVPYNITVIEYNKCEQTFSSTSSVTPKISKSPCLTLCESLYCIQFHNKDTGIDKQSLV